MGNTTGISSTESNLSDSENDSCDLNDVKLIPNMSTFVRERQENVCQPNLKKVEKTTRYDYQSVTLGDKYVSRAAANMIDKSNTWHSKPTFQQQDILPEHCVRNVDSREDMPTAFKSGCLLPEFPELRDSYDQFCTTPSESSSREELEGKRNIRDLDIYSANGTRVLGTSYSKYSSDDIPDSVHLCKRRKKTIFEQASDAHERYQRWSMPEFTKLWYETMDSDSESTVTDQTEIVKEHQELSSVDQSTQVPASSAMTNTSKSNGSPNPCRHLSPSRRVVNEEYGDTEEQISGKNGNFFLKESVSCPAIGSTRSPTNFHSAMYDSSGFCEDSVDSSASSSSSPTHSRVLVNTASKNGECDYWHESHFSENDRLVTSPEDPADSILEATTSTCEASVCASDSGYSGMSNGTRDSPEGEEQDNYDPLGDKRIDILSEPHLFKTLKHLHEKLGAQSDSESEADNETSGVRLQHDDLQPNSVKSNPQSKTHLLAFPHIIIENTTTEAGRKDERCAQLMEEFRVNKTMNPHLTRSSLYRTYEV